MDKKNAVSAFGSQAKLARALKFTEGYISKTKVFSFRLKLMVIGAAFLLGLVEQLDLEDVRAEINARTERNKDAL